jgi:hypothetical protein
LSFFFLSTLSLTSPSMVVEALLDDTRPLVGLAVARMRADGGEVCAPSEHG